MLEDTTCRILDARARDAQAITLSPIMYYDAARQILSEKMPRREDSKYQATYLSGSPGLHNAAKLEEGSPPSSENITSARQQWIQVKISCRVILL